MIEIFTEPLKYEFIQRALIASIAIGVSCGLIGTYIMLRRMSLIGDALAHSVLPGVVIAFIVSGKSEIALFIGALIAGVVSSVLISFVQRNSKIKEDTSIGIIFTGAFALGILLVSQLKQVHIDLSSYLFGDVLGVSNGDIILSGIITLLIILSVILFYKQLLVTSFDPVMAKIIGISTGAVHYFLMTLLSMSIVSGLQSVGVILIIAMLITPPATAFLLTDKLKNLLIISSLTGVISAIAGLYFSYYFNWTSGASIVLVAVFFFALAFLFSPKEGIVMKYLKRLRTQKINSSEDVVRLVYKFGEIKSANELKNILVAETGISPVKVNGILTELIKKGCVIRTNGHIELTEKGKEMAVKLIRSHRLWETYITEKNIVNEENIHEDAHKYEHLLNDDLVEELDKELGHPEKDPHGSPIPKKK
ncbi:MAG: metal ABC transporter permease [Ignavibacteria bacterium]|nr:metal ABC transporter permease [Ignavibacteria bacterium]